ncbi:hypothetical protein V5799_016994 [Amblyomma americanum]|uniref:Uncharacterized protein n=1 Tax=Amblyomma americanum TaxID=6943 RepID=A0AAQ4F4K0_AMBAM
MSYADGGRKKYQLSPCSESQIRAVLRYVGQECLDEISEKDYMARHKKLPGQMITKEEYCKILFKAQGTGMPVEDPKSLKECKMHCCLRTYYGPGKCEEDRLLEGMACGDGKPHIVARFPLGGHLAAAAASGSTSNPCTLLFQEIKANFDSIPKCNGDNDSRLPSWFLKALATCLIITALLKRYLLMGGSIISLAAAGLTALAMLVLYAFQEYRRRQREVTVFMGTRHPLQHAEVFNLQLSICASSPPGANFGTIYEMTLTG